MRLLVALALLSGGVAVASQATSQSDLQAQLATALDQLRAGNTDKALTLYRQTLQKYPNSAEAHNWLGVALADKSNLLQAIAEFRKAVALDPKFARAWTNLGSTLAKSGDTEESVRAFRKALACDPKDAAAHMNLALALRASGDARAATQELRWILAKYPRDPGSNMNWRRLCARAGICKLPSTGSKQHSESTRNSGKPIMDSVRRSNRWLLPTGVRLRTLMPKRKIRWALLSARNGI